MVTYVYGHSDDLVEVDGDVDREDMVYLDPGETHEMSVLGTVIRVTFDGGWGFEVVYTGEDAHAVTLPNEAVSTEKFNDYTDVVVIEERP